MVINCCHGIDIYLINIYTAARSSFNDVYVPGYLSPQGELLVPIDTIANHAPYTIVEDPGAATVAGGGGAGNDAAQGGPPVVVLPPNVADETRKYTIFSMENTRLLRTDNFIQQPPPPLPPPLLPPQKKPRKTTKWSCQLAPLATPPLLPRKLNLLSRL